ncbi:hypothetical protein [Bacillus phage phiAGATE]|uniref:Uncharacterized protein n=1 Tax=Bacillus phage phiAGATE TaxID=1204533 RepID=L0LAD2_9CAUD|nr:hypothetical protein G380_gp027 [Bacillus phage phiAGATE]AGB62677.1 hypothetical protein [Bacillus phage phiAGATE]
MPNAQSKIFDLDGYKDRVRVSELTLKQWMKEVNLSMTVEEFLSDYTYDDTESIMRFLNLK